MWYTNDTFQGIQVVGLMILKGKFRYRFVIHKPKNYLEKPNKNCVYCFHILMNDHYQYGN